MYEPEHGEHPSQSDQVHFIGHFTKFEKHQLLQDGLVVREHDEHPSQVDQEHFILHGFPLEAHQASHEVVVVVVVPEHDAHPSQAGQAHFAVHRLPLEAHQPSHTAASHSGSALVAPTALVSLPGGHCFWAMHFSLGQPSHHTNTRTDHAITEAPRKQPSNVNNNHNHVIMGRETLRHNTRGGNVVNDSAKAFTKIYPTT